MFEKIFGISKYDKATKLPFYHKLWYYPLSLITIVVFYIGFVFINFTESFIENYKEDDK